MTRLCSDSDKRYSEQGNPVAFLPTQIKPPCTAPRVERAHLGLIVGVWLCFPNAHFLIFRATLQLETCRGLINLITFNFLPPETCSQNLGSVLACSPGQTDLPMPWEQSSPGS